MKRLLLVALVLGLMISPEIKAAPADCAQVLTPMGYESITVGATAIGFTSTLITPTGGTPAQYALVTVETNDLRYREDGVSPTNSEGHLVPDGQTIEVCGQTTLQRVRFIEAVEAANATIKVSYYKPTN